MKEPLSMLGSLVRPGVQVLLVQRSDDGKKTFHRGITQAQAATLFVQAWKGFMHCFNASQKIFVPASPRKLRMRVMKMKMTMMTTSMATMMVAVAMMMTMAEMHWQKKKAKNYTIKQKEIKALYLEFSDGKSRTQYVVLPLLYSFFKSR